MKEIRIVLGEKALLSLMCGGEVTVKGAAPGTDVKMILQDIGFAAMQECVVTARSGLQTYKGVTVNADGQEIK